MIQPNTEGDLAAAIRDASGPLRIQGGGTRFVGGSGAPLSTTNLSGIELYEPGALTIVVKAGTPLEDVTATLAAENQRLPFEPMDHRGLLGTDGTPSIGGVVAANISGPRRVQVGACRDFLLGVRFVDGSGTALKNGGRVMKNVTGYDLVKLMAGSHGTLGVLTEVAFKVLPQVEASAVLLINGLSNEDAIAAMSKALGSPFDVSGAAHTPAGIDGHPVTMIRIEGFSDSITYRSGKLKDLLGSFGDISVETDPGKVAAGWAWVRDAEQFHGTDKDVWRISVKPSDGGAVAAALKEARTLFDWGGGLVWAEVPQGTDVRTALSSIKGHATLVRADEVTRQRLGVFHPEPAALAGIAAGLRQKFDPRGILNPGRMAS